MDLNRIEGMALMAAVRTKNGEILVAYSPDTDGGSRLLPTAFSTVAEVRDFLPDHVITGMLEQEIEIKVLAAEPDSILRWANRTKDVPPVSKAGVGGYIWWNLGNFHNPGDGYIWDEGAPLLPSRQNA
jgi:hypothetical protein